MRLSLSLALAAAGLAASALPAAAGTLLVPQQFPTIQKALNAAKPGDTVLVLPKSSGKPYSEAVTISTPHVVLQGKNNPVIDGTALATIVTPFPTIPTFTERVSPNGIEISADHVAVRGLTIQGFGFGDDANGPASAVNVGTSVSTGLFSGGEVSYSDIEISGNTLQKNYNGLTIQGYTGSDPYYSGTNTYLKGYQVLGNTLIGNTSTAAVISGASVMVSGNKFNSSGADGLDVTGIGVTVSGNEAGGNANYGMTISDAAYTYNPAVNDPKNPNPAPVVTVSNSIHDNGLYGLQANGTQTILGNAITNNTGNGINLVDADFSTISGNVISGTTLAGYLSNDGTGIYAEYSATYTGNDSGLTISGNQISGNAGDGIYFYEISGGLISFNSVTGNQGIGIHLSDHTYQYGDAPTTVTLNLAQHNKIFDARDDAAAPADISYNGGSYYGDGAPLYNIWTKNLFGTTDPKGLSK